MKQKMFSKMSSGWVIFFILVSVFIFFLGVFVGACMAEDFKYEDINEEYISVCVKYGLVGTTSILPGRFPA